MPEIAPSSDEKRPSEQGRKRKCDLEARLVELAMRIAEIVELLPNTRLGNHVAGQLIKSGTSPAPNYAEAQGAESRSDFIHKLSVVLKEPRETRVWLLIIQRKGMLRRADLVESTLAETNELIAILISSRGTARKNMEKEAKGC